MSKQLRYYALLFQSLFLLPMAQANEWDWVPRESLSAAQQDTLNQYCHGAYVDGWHATDSQHTRLIADLIYRDEQGTLFMEGTATLLQSGSQLNANHIQGHPHDHYQATGRVSLRNKGQLIRSDSAYITTADEQDKTARFINAKYLSHESGLRGQANEITRRQNGVIFIDEGFFTTCEPGDGTWQLYGSSIKLRPDEGVGTAKHVQIKIHDIPVFYFPWLRFPLNNSRQTGLLFPTLSYDAHNNLTLSAPFYINLAANYDATITPNIITKMGPLPQSGPDNGQGIDIELRHLSPYGRSTFEQSTFFSRAKDKATLRKFTTEQQFTQHFTAGIHAEDNPTPNLEPEVNSTSLSSKDNYERRIYSRYNAGDFNSEVQVRRYQTPDVSQDQPLEWKPRVSASYHRGNTDYSYTPDIEFTDFYEPDAIGVDGKRIALNQDFHTQAENVWGRVTLGALHQYRHYRLHHYSDGSQQNSDTNHLSYYLDSDVVFERNVIHNEQRWKQTLTPRLSYLNAPYLAQSDIPNFDTTHVDMSYAQAFAHRRFIGNDRIGDTEQVALGLESRFYDGNHINRWTLQGGRVFYLRDRKVDTTGDTGNVVDDSPYSALLTSASYNGDNVTLVNNVNIDTDQERVDLAQAALNYASDSGLVLNLSFSYVYDEDEEAMTKQSGFATIIPLNENWHFFHQQSYDWLEHADTTKVDGFGYENCCVKSVISYQRWHDQDGRYDEGVFLQFILRSLSGVGRGNSHFTSIADDYWNEGKVGY